MLSPGQLQKTLTALVRGKSDIVLYGNKGSGKTHLITKVLDDVLGAQNYITIKCIFLSDRNSLFYLVTQELKRVLRNFDSQFIFHDFFSRKEKQEDCRIPLDAWITKMNRMITQSLSLFKKIPRIYVFLDNIQDFCLSQNFFKDFYFAFKTQLKCLKFSFVFCGITFKSPLFTISQPLRLLPTFFMPKPNIKDLIEGAVNDCCLVKRHQQLLKKNVHLKQKSKSSKIDELKKKNAQLLTEDERIQLQVYCIPLVINEIKLRLISAFETIQYQIQRILAITNCYIRRVVEFIGQNMKKQAFLWLEASYKKHDEEALQKLKNFGAVTLERVDEQILRKQQGTQHLQEGDGQATFYLQNYPNLINLSLFLANGFPQSQDKNRFIDLRKTKSAHQKSRMRHYQHAEMPFKIDQKKKRHTRQRIIAISQVIQEQATTNRFREKSLPHHSLDYYGCFQYLRQEGYINCFGSQKGKFGGTIVGYPKQSQYKEYMGKLSLNYKQFTGRD